VPKEEECGTRWSGRSNSNKTSLSKKRRYQTQKELPQPGRLWGLVGGHTTQGPRLVDNKIGVCKPREWNWQVGGGLFMRVTKEHSAGLGTKKKVENFAGLKNGHNKLRKESGRKSQKKQEKVHLREIRTPRNAVQELESRKEEFRTRGGKRNGGKEILPSKKRESHLVGLTLAKECLGQTERVKKWAKRCHGSRRHSPGKVRT